MNITYLKNVSKRRNSTRRPSGGTTHTARLKHDTSVENPVFMLDVVDPDINYIIAMGHYYYVTDIIILNNDQAEYHCEQDVLATYRSQILGSTQFVERCATQDYWDTQIIDEVYPVQIDPNIYQTNQSTPFLTRTVTTPSVAGPTLILSLKSDNGTDFWAMRRGVFADLGHELYSMSQDQDSLWSSINSGTLYKTYLDPMQYITGAKIIPIDVLSMSNIDAASSSIDVGYWTYTDSLGGGYFYKVLDPIIYTSSEYTLTFQARNINQNNFLNCNKFRQYSLSLPGAGTIDLDANIVLTGNNIKVKFTVDVVGTICYQVSYGSGNIYKEYLTGDISIPFAVHGQTADFSKTIGAGVNVIGGIVSGAAAGAVGGPIGAVAGGILGGISGGVMAAGHSLASAGPLFRTQSAGNDGSFARLSVNSDIILKETIYHPSGMSANRLGVPCMRELQLSKLSGFTKCQNASVPLTGFSEDRAAVEAYLNSGFYIE